MDHQSHKLYTDVNEILQRHIWRKHGITITGPDPRTLIAPISPADLRRAVSDIPGREWIGLVDRA